MKARDYTERQFLRAAARYGLSWDGLGLYSKELQMTFGGIYAPGTMALNRRATVYRAVRRVCEERNARKASAEGGAP